MTIRPTGDLDVATVQGFRQQVRGALEDAPDVLVLDLSEVTFLDSSGIAVIAMALRTQRGRGGGVSVVGAQPIVHRALELVGLTDLFT